MFKGSNQDAVNRWKLPSVFITFAVLCIVHDAALLPVVTVAAQQVTTFIPSKPEPVPSRTLPVAERLVQLHTALATARDPHDIVLEIGDIGDSSSVPFLIETLAKFGTEPRRAERVIDSRVHVLEALQAITNHDAGRNGEDWRTWYEANKNKTQQQWIADGFAEHGFPVSEPPADAFVTALIRASDPKYQPRYMQTSALRTLSTAPANMVVRLAKALSASTESAARRGAVAALEKVDNTSRLEVLRDLTKDGDIEVAESSLRTLNEALRSNLPTITAEPVWEVRLAKARVHVLNVLDDHTVVVGIGGIVDTTQVAGLDLATHKIIWTYPTADGVRSRGVQIGRRLYFVSDDRVLHCISVTGKPVWAKPLTSNPDLGATGPAIVAAIGRLFVPDENSLYVATPDGQVQAYAMGERVSRSLVQGRRRVFSAIHNGPLLVFDDPTRPPRRVNTGLKIATLSTAGNVVCVVSFGPTHQLQCLNQETLHERWRADLPNDSGGYLQLEQDSENVYVRSWSHALAFNVSTGKRLWATNEFTSGAFFKIVGSRALTRNNHFELEWRDLSSGEVIGVWGKRDGDFASDVAMAGDTVLVEMSDSSDRGDGLRLLKAPAALKSRPTPR